MTIYNATRQAIGNYLIDTGCMSGFDIDDWSTQELRQMIIDGGPEEIEAFNGYVG